MLVAMQVVVVLCWHGVTYIGSVACLLHLLALSAAAPLGCCRDLLPGSGVVLPCPGGTCNRQQRGLRDHSGLSPLI
jgi:hypothetical protein